MGHFTIDLPEGKKADVRFGTVFKISFSLLRRKKAASQKGYIIQVSGPGQTSEYRFFKTQQGDWYKDPEGEMKLDEQDVIIQQAIVARERELPRG